MPLNANVLFTEFPFCLKLPEPVQVKLSLLVLVEVAENSSVSPLQYWDFDVIRITGKLNILFMLIFEVSLHPNSLVVTTI